MSEVLQPKALCWDLDETIGNYARIGFEFEGVEAPDYIRPTSLRYGMKELLDEFSPEAGFVHFITTSASPRYAKEALRRSGINDHFRKVFTRNEISGEYGGKIYTPAAQEMGYSIDQMEGNMLVIGDAPGDKPVDADLVFLEVGWISAHNTDALVIREILTSLLTKGDGHFKKGFEALWNEAIIENPEETNPQYVNRVYDLGNGIKFNLEYRTRDDYDENATVPVITKITAPEYAKEPILI